MRDFIVTPPVEQSEEDEYTIVLPTHKKLAIQARQSRKRQAMYNKESWEAQTTIMYQKAIRKGWSDKDVIMLIENKRKDGTLTDASGTRRIDQRPTMQDLWGLIGRDAIGAVMTRAVDRLFRHVNMIEPAQFALHCKEHNVMILTEHQRFDFVKRPEDTKRFLAEAQKGAEYVVENIGMMNRYRREKSLRGEYDGRALPAGFVLDSERMFYVVLEEHARVVVWLFQRFRELDGNFATLYREVAAMPYLFPNVPGVKLSRMTPVEGGYSITPRGLRDLLSNPAYLGWWLVYDNSRVTVDSEDGATRSVIREKRLVAKIEHNHPQIVDAVDFWFAYDRLHPEIEGRRTRERFSKHGTISAEAVLEGVVVGENDSRVYVNQAADGPETAIYEIVGTPDKVPVRHGAVYVQTLDKIFVAYLLEKLEEGKRLRAKFARVGLPPDEVDTLENVLALHFMAAAKGEQANTAEFEKKLADYRAEAASLERTLHYGAAALPGETIAKFSEDLAKLHVDIEQLELKRKRAARAAVELAKFVQRLDIEWSFFDEWHNSPRSQFFIWQRKGRGKAWTDEEKSILRNLYPRSTRREVLEALPRRAWLAIITQSTRMGLSRPRQESNIELPNNLSVEDATFMQQVGLEYEAEQVVWAIESSEDRPTAML